ncbi:MAG: helix-turn-helix domain-containing protein, partial [Microcystis aeruginosa G13-11]|nr:helix-turn-helix domain-containing protein [Microcystis aeruginosa G13-11]
MKARYQYRLYPTNQQKRLLSQLFGCVRVVWNAEVSSIPLQQSLRDLETAYSNFFASCKGERKGKKVKPPKFKKRKSKQSARFTDNGFTVNQHHVTLAKIGDLKVVWSRPLSVISYQLSVI